MTAQTIDRRKLLSMGATISGAALVAALPALPASGASNPDWMLAELWQAYRDTYAREREEEDENASPVYCGDQPSYDIAGQILDTPAEGVRGLLVKLLLALEYSNIQDDYQAHPRHPGEAAVMSAMEDLRRMVGSDFAAQAGATAPLFDPNAEPYSPFAYDGPERPDWDKPVIDLHFDREDLEEARAVVSDAMNRAERAGNDAERIRLAGLYRDVSAAIAAIEDRIARLEPDSGYGIGYQTVILAHAYRNRDYQPDSAAERVARRIIRWFDRAGFHRLSPDWRQAIEAEQAERDRMNAERDLLVGLPEPLDRTPTPPSVTTIEQAERVIAKAEAKRLEALPA